MEAAGREARLKKMLGDVILEHMLPPIHHDVQIHIVVDVRERHATRVGCHAVEDVGSGMGEGGRPVVEQNLVGI